MKSKNVDKRAMAVLSAGHLFTDINQGVVPALLPFLVSGLGLSYAAAAGLVLAATMSSSVVQPVFGHFSDRRSLIALLPAGLLIGGAGISLVGLFHSYVFIFLAIVMSGLGVAAFHPEASRFANYVSGSRRATGMSLFSVGGNLGFALGPILATQLLLAFGLKGTLFLIVPAAVMSGILLLELQRISRFQPAIANVRQADISAAPAAWGPFIRLVGVIAARSLVYFGLVAFVPLYYIQVFKASESQAAMALSVMLVSGAVGTLIGGPLADRFGRRTILMASMLVLPPLIFGFILAGETLGVILLAFIGAATIATFGITIVMGQEYLPGRIGVASGFTIGFSIGLGGVGAPLLGVVADNFGLTAAMATAGVLPLIGLLLIFTLPSKVPQANFSDA